MLVILTPDVTEAHMNRIEKRISDLGYNSHRVPGKNRMAIAVTGNDTTEYRVYLESLPGVDRVISISQPFKLASRESHPDNTVVKIDKVNFGDGNVVMIAGPCAVENLDQTLRIADRYSFQGLGEKGLEILVKARENTGLPFVTEVMDHTTAPLVSQYADMLQIGTRNMQNFILLKEIGKLGKPILMKRGLSATLEETLMSAEYLISHGCRDIVICERGVRTFSNHARNTLDISIIPALKRICHLPIIVDPSHSSGHRYSVIPHSLAGIGAGADGLIVDVHDRPEEALCDGPQALLPEHFSELMQVARSVSKAIGKSIGTDKSK
jgi:3-deoxy-7-phosphoheptulonate synthase